jgi:hypothetical protein
MIDGIRPRSDIAEGTPMRSLLAMERGIYRYLSVGMALLAALTLVLALVATADAGGRGGGGHGGRGHGGGGHGGGNRGGWHGGHGRGGHGHGGGHWHGGWHGGWGPRFYGFYGVPFTYPYPYYAYPYPYGYTAPAYSYPYPPTTYSDVVVSQPQAGYQNGGSYQPPAVQREVFFPNGKYVLYGDGLSQPWRWVWVPNGS